MRCAHHVAQAAQDALFGVRVHAGKRVIQNQNFRLAQYRARDGRPLFLAARKRDAALAHHRVVALREALDLARNAGDFRGFENVLFQRGVHAERDVFAQSVAEKKRVLRHVPDRAPHFRQRIVANRAAVEEQRSRRRIPQPRNQRRERGFAAPGRPDDRERRAGRHVQIDVAQNRPAARAIFVPRGRISKRQMPELDFAANRRFRHCRRASR